MRSGPCDWPKIVKLTGLELLPKPPTPTKRATRLCVPTLKFVRSSVPTESSPATVKSREAMLVPLSATRTKPIGGRMPSSGETFAVSVMGVPTTAFVELRLSDTLVPAAKLWLQAQINIAQNNKIRFIISWLLVSERTLKNSVRKGVSAEVKD
jgi:hypothetical protein